MGMTTSEQRRYASSTHHSVPERHLSREPSGRREIGCPARDGAHIGGILRIAFDFGRFLEERPRRFVEVEWEIELRQSRQARGQVIDGVVFHRKRTVAAWVGDFKAKVLNHL